MRGVWCDGSTARLRDDLPPPEPRPGEVVLDVLAAGICETDVQLTHGYMGYRGILGHEFVGRTTDGRRVAAEINNPCGACATCQAGRPRHCPHRTVMGILNHPGAMAEQVAVPRANLHPIPDRVPDQAAVFVEPLAAAFQMVDQLKPGAGDRVAVVGDGKLGLLCALALRGTGAAIHVLGKHPEKLSLAGTFATTHLAGEADPPTRCFDAVIDATGSPTGLPTALRLVRPCGTIVLKTTVAAPYTIDLSALVIDEIRLLGSRCGAFPRAIAALARGEVDVTPLIGAVFPLAEAEAAFRAAVAPGARKILLQVAAIS